MVARGDLGMEIPPEKVFLAQKMMIRKCQIAGKPVITATQMLESMITNPRPTRAECTDVANAVLDGTDAVMLSGETANGEYPEEAVRIMCRVVTEAEAAINYYSLSQAVRNTCMAERGSLTPAESVCSSSVMTAMDIGAKLIIVLTESGDTARMLSKFRPPMPILVFTGMEHIARQCQGLLKGVTAINLGSMIGTDSIIMRAMEQGRERGWVVAGDTVVAVHGMRECESGNTNVMRVMTVA
jgi:pyruvate kinase